MPKYEPDEEEARAHRYCLDNNIRISPGGTSVNDRWTVDISLDGRTWNKSPQSYPGDEVWEVFYNYCKFYYGKRKQI